MNNDSKQLIKAVLGIAFFLFAWGYASNCDLEVINLISK